MIKQSLICSLNGQSKQSESWTPNTARKRNSAYDIALEELENCLSSGITVEDEVEGKLLVQTIEDFLDSLTPEQQRKDTIHLNLLWAQREGARTNVRS